MTAGQQGNVWAESRLMGMKLVFYACIDKKIWDVTEWARCQVRAPGCALIPDP